MITLAEPKLSVILNNKTSTRTTYEISGLMQGLSDGYISALRMMLLQYIPGIKPIAVKMMGVSSESDRPALMMEAMKDILRAMELIRVKPKEDKYDKIFQVIKIDKKMKGEIKLSDFDLGDLEALNPELILMNSSEEQHVQIEIIMMLGMGFLKESEVVNIPKEFKANDGVMIRMDADFCPVVNAVYTKLDNNPIEGKETLLVDIETDGRVDTKTAISMASTMMISYMQPLTKISSFTWEEIPIAKTEQEVKSNLDLPIEYLKLSPEIYNELKENKVISIKDITLGGSEYTPQTQERLKEELAKIGLSEVALRDIKTEDGNYSKETREYIKSTLSKIGLKDIEDTQISE